MKLSKKTRVKNERKSVEKYPQQVLFESLKIKKSLYVFFRHFLQSIFLNHYFMEKNMTVAIQHISRNDYILKHSSR